MLLDKVSRSLSRLSGFIELAANYLRALGRHHQNMHPKDRREENEQFTRDLVSFISWWVHYDW